VAVTVFVATLLVLIDSARRRAPVFLPIRQAATDTSQPVDTLRLTGARWRAGDVVTRVTAIDLHQPSLPVSYYVIDDATTSAAFDISESTGVMTLTSPDASLLAGLRVLNVTVQAVITDHAGDTRTSSTVLSFEMIDSVWSTSSVGGLAWDCVNEQATVTENSARATSVATLRARSSDAMPIVYYVVDGDAEHVFDINALTVSL